MIILIQDRVADKELVTNKCNVNGVPDASSTCQLIGCFLATKQWRDAVDLSFDMIDAICGTASSPVSTEKSASDIDCEYLCWPASAYIGLVSNQTALR